MNLILKLFANNEFRFVLQSIAYKRKNYGDRTAQRKRALQAKLVEELRIIDGLLSSSDSPLIPVVDVRPGGKLVEEMLSRADLEARRSALLDITKKSQQRVKKHQEYGCPHPKRNFTANARHRILEAGAIIDRNFERDCTKMVTLTLPGSTQAAIAATANWSGWIVNRMLQVLRRSELEENLMWFYVFELQKRGALHMHWCLATDNAATTEKLAIAIKDKWFECLLELQSKIGVDCFQKKQDYTHRNNPAVWKYDIQTTKKSVAAYFSKYVSKEAKNQKRLGRWQQRKLYYPARWWGSSQSVKKAIKAWRYEHRIEGLTKEQGEHLRELIWQLLDSWKWMMKYEYKFTIEHPSVPVPLCSGHVQIAYGEPDTWLSCHTAIKDLCDSGIVKALADYVVREEEEKYYNLPQGGQNALETRWAVSNFASPFTGELFKTPYELQEKEIEFLTAQLEIEHYDKYLKEADCNYLAGQLQKLSYESGFANSKNPYLIKEKTLDMMMDFANSQMDLIKESDSQLKQSIAPIPRIHCMDAINPSHGCNDSPVSNNKKDCMDAITLQYAWMQ